MATARSGVVDLNGTGHYLHWGVIQISVANAIVILLMILVFALALIIPFHGHGAEVQPVRQASAEAGDEGSR